MSDRQEDFLYAIVKRTIGGQTKRYVEVFASRAIDPDDPATWTFLDSYLSYDGRNKSDLTLTATFTNGTNVSAALAASLSQFDGSSVGDYYKLTAGGKSVTVLITAVSSAIAATGTIAGVTTLAQKTALNGVATSNCAIVVNSVSGLGHLEGESITVIADGVVSTATVSSGAVSIATRSAVIIAGIGYNCDIETMEIDQEGTSLRDRKKRVGGVTVIVEETMGLSAGPDADHLDEYAPDDPTETETAPSDGQREIRIAATWSVNGHVYIRQSKPLPAKILGVIPNGDLGG